LKILQILNQHFNFPTIILTNSEIRWSSRDKPLCSAAVKVVTQASRRLPSRFRQTRSQYKTQQCCEYTHHEDHVTWNSL